MNFRCQRYCKLPAFFVICLTTYNAIQFVLSSLCLPLIQLLSLQEQLLMSSVSYTNEFFDRCHFSKTDWNALLGSGITNTRNKEYTSDESCASDTEASKINLNKRLFRQYKREDVAACLDLLPRRRNRTIHIAFLGDSLVRNQFLSFISVR